MEYRSEQIVACIDHTKDACLYFDEVIPLNLGHVIPWEGNGEPDAHEILKQVLPKELLDPSMPLELNHYVLSYIDAFTNMFPISIGYPEASEEVMKKRAKHFLPLLIQRQNEMFSTLSKPVNTIFGVGAANEESAVQEPALILNSLKLVDTSGLSWKHLLEIKKDKEAMKSLRRLHTFIYQNYKDKPLAFIEDDLLNRIDQYDTSTKHLGLKTKDAALKIIFNSSTLIAGATAAIFSALSGGATNLPLTLAVGSTFMLGNIGLELRSMKREAYKFKQENPVTFVIDIHKRLSE